MFKIDYREDGAVRRWTTTEDGATVTVDTDYRPTIYLWAAEWETVQTHREHVAAHPNVASVTVASKRPGWRHDPQDVLEVTLTDIEAVDALAPQLANMGRPGDLRLFNVDFSRGFRYCLETGQSPVPTGSLHTLSIDVPAVEVHREGHLREATVEGESITGDPSQVLDGVLDRIHDADPDVLVLSSAEIVPELFAIADTQERDPISIGRLPGYRKLAGESTYESYGQVGHSPARYSVPGRAIIDRSNTFFYAQTNLAGVLDLVARSHKPLQELAWASIGNVLTAIQIRAATRRDVLVPWRSFRHEQFKTMGQLRAADRGGFTFSPDVGLHEDVHELDFASMYPNIIVTRNISPETIRGDCDSSTTVPELDYEICEQPGYLPDVLEPLVTAREEIKAERAATDDPEQRAALAGRAEAIKWILVSCFGYQGFSNAKFGRIEAHEAINAYAREILLTAKERLEAGGWRVVHGIVDSIWVTPMAETDQRPLGEITAAITEATGIELEYEAAYDWVAFVPKKDTEAGALTRYFGRRADPAPDESPVKVRGIEARQRSTCDWVGDLQRTLIEVLDEHREPEPVLDVLRERLDRLARGAVDPERLLLTNRVGKPLAEYTQSTRNVAALKRTRATGIDLAPGQDVSYVVVDDSKTTRERVRLQGEPLEDYDADFYRKRAVRAAASVLSPLGVRERDIESHLADFESTSVTGWTVSREM
ncbi:DNA-directed DNA polymerase [Halodesulfurarchaeum formicicum]|uniref:DNA-directed DNA polymerase n=1 Tax=Halodesulfurarchaeum formicicum TaxID=1873524 RepID=A0A1D8S2L9_9EURY|nr:type B DNA-directed DNA polymerase [Halodesulfurarchaeum formicicum]AOW79600.1 DNA-directed DNA polymerase [Halodesulfurarchaeum formicicum]